MFDKQNDSMIRAVRHLIHSCSHLASSYCGFNICQALDEVLETDEHRPCVYSPGEKKPLKSKHNANVTADAAEVSSLTGSSGDKKKEWSLFTWKLK